MKRTAKTWPVARLRATEVRRRLLEMGLRQGVLAYRLRVSPSYFSQLLSGRKYPSPELRETLMALLHEHDFHALFEIIERSPNTQGGSE